MRLLARQIGAHLRHRKAGAGRVQQLLAGGVEGGAWARAAWRGRGGSCQRAATKPACGGGRDSGGPRGSGCAALANSKARRGLRRPLRGNGAWQCRRCWRHPLGRGWPQGCSRVVGEARAGRGASKGPWGAPQQCRAPKARVRCSSGARGAGGNKAHTTRRWRRRRTQHSGGGGGARCMDCGNRG